MLNLETLRPEDIRRFRADAEMSRIELSQALGAGLRTIEDWEAGRRRPPPMLRMAFAALARSISPWEPDPPLGLDASRDDVEFHTDKIFVHQGDAHAEELSYQFSDCLPDGASPVEMLLCARMMDHADGYKPIHVCGKWTDRHKFGLITNMSFLPDGFEIRPTIIVECRLDESVKLLVVFIDKHRPGERLPEKLRAETGLIARGYRILSFSETDVLAHETSCADIIDLVISELVEEVYFEAGKIPYAWKSPNRRSYPTDG